MVEMAHIALKLTYPNQTEIKKSLDDVESHIYEWIHSTKYKHNWKHHKTAVNEQLIVNDVPNNDIKNIVIHCLDDIDPKNKKYKIWKAVAYIPSITPEAAIKCYTLPKYHLEFDDLNTMKKLKQFIVEMNDKQKDEHNEQYDINVAVTNPKINGWISSRLCVNICCAKYSHKMDSYCCFGRFMQESMLKQLQNKLNITAQEMKYVLSKNLNLYWGAKPVVIETANNQNIKLTKITYILQINNGGWIPQWAVEMGLIDQHMIVIFKQITKWLNNNSIENINHVNNEIIEIETQPLNQPSDDIKTEMKRDIIEMKEEKESECISEISEYGHENDILSADSNIESFNKFINRKSVCDWIEINDNENENELTDEQPLLVDYGLKEKYNNNKHIIYNKIEDLEPESSDQLNESNENEDIEIIQMTDFENDTDDLLSEGVYIDKTEISKKEKQITRCSCLVNQKNECLVM